MASLLLLFEFFLDVFHNFSEGQLGDRILLSRSLAEVFDIFILNEVTHGLLHYIKGGSLTLTTLSMTFSLLAFYLA
jgi:hypothetical protein